MKQTTKTIIPTELATLDPFTRGYLWAAAQASDPAADAPRDEDGEETGPSPDYPEPPLSLYAPAFLKRALRDCAEFQAAHAALIAAHPAYHERPDVVATQAGADFWQVRNDEGPYFFDGWSDADAEALWSAGEAVFAAHGREEGRRILANGRRRV